MTVADLEPCPVALIDRRLSAKFLSAHQAGPEIGTADDPILWPAPLSKRLSWIPWRGDQWKTHGTDSLHLGLPYARLLNGEFW